MSQLRARVRCGRLAVGLEEVWQQPSTCPSMSEEKSPGRGYLSASGPSATSLGLVSRRR